MSEIWRKAKIIFTRHERFRFFQLLILQLIGSIMEMMTVYLMLPFVTAIENEDSILDSQLFFSIYSFLKFDNKKYFVAFFSLVLAILYIIKNVYLFLLTKVQNRYLYRLDAEVSVRILRRLLSRPYSFHVQTNSAEIVQQTTVDVDTLFGTISAVFSLVCNGMSMILIVVVLLKTNVTLTIVAGLLVFISMVLINRTISVKLRKAGEMNRFHNAEKIRWVYEAEGGLKGIITNKREEYFVRGYAKAAFDYARQFGGYQVLASMPRYTMETVILGGMFGIGAIAICVVENIPNMIPVFALFAMAAYRLISLANSFNASINTVKYNSKALDIIYHTMEDPDKIADISGSIRAYRGMQNLEKGVRLEHIKFRFENSKDCLYDDFSLFIPANKSVAFIGTTGSGKTTLADIILGLQKPQEGRVIVDNVNIEDRALWWADRIGYIPQVIYLCDDTIRANVAFGIPKEEIDDERVWECLKKAQIYDFIKQLDDGLDTRVGENGMRLSGGQRQRIGIARALYTDPPFLVMDEATSSLDNETEQSIIDAINEFSGKKTMLIIAHRLSTIKDCDIIYRIDNGRAIVERGQEYLE